MQTQETISIYIVAAPMSVNRPKVKPVVACVWLQPHLS